MTVLAALVATVVVAAEASPPAPGKTLEDALRRHGVSIETPSVVDALEHEESTVRGLAALILAAREVREATSPIAQALDKEQDKQTATELAYALAALGMNRGQVALQALCHDVDAAVQVEASRWMLHLDDESCFGDLVEVVASKDAPSDALEIGLSLLPAFEGAMASERSRHRACTAIGTALSNSSSLHIRGVAVYSLERIGGACALQELVGAASTESDEQLRRDMENAIKRLERPCGR